MLNRKPIDGSFTNYAKEILLGAVLFATSSGACLAELPPEVRLDQYMMMIETQQKTGNFRAASEYFKKIDGLDLAPPANYRFLRARNLKATGDWRQARREVTAYLEAAGTSGENYQDALKLLNSMEPSAARGEIEQLERKVVTIEKKMNQVEREGRGLEQKIEQEENKKINSNQPHEVWLRQREAHAEKLNNLNRQVEELSRTYLDLKLERGRINQKIKQLREKVEKE